MWLDKKEIFLYIKNIFKIFIINVYSLLVKKT